LREYFERVFLKKKRLGNDPEKTVRKGTKNLRASKRNTTAGKVSKQRTKEFQKEYREASAETRKIMNCKEGEWLKQTEKKSLLKRTIGLHTPHELGEKT